MNDVVLVSELRVKTWQRVVEMWFLGALLPDETLKITAELQVLTLKI